METLVNMTTAKTEHVNTLMNFMEQNQILVPALAIAAVLIVVNFFLKVCFPE